MGGQRQETAPRREGDEDVPIPTFHKKTCRPCLLSSKMCSLGGNGDQRMLNAEMKALPGFHETDDGPHGTRRKRMEQKGKDGLLRRRPFKESVYQREREMCMGASRKMRNQETRMGKGARHRGTKRLRYVQMGQREKRTERRKVCERRELLKTRPETWLSSGVRVK